MIKERANKVLYNIKHNQSIDDKPILKDHEEEEREKQYDHLVIAANRELFRDANFKKIKEAKIPVHLLFNPLIN